MRLLIYFTIIGLLTNCSGDKEPIQRLTDYEYPLDSLNNGKIFVYERHPPGQYFFIQQKRTKENGTDYIIQETFDTKQKVSAEKYRVTEQGKELIESYLYYYPDSLSSIKDRGEIIELKNIGDYKQYRGMYFEFHITTSGNISAKSTTKETFNREAVIELGNKKLDVIIFNNILEISARHKYIPFFSSESVYTGENYYAKRLGLVKYWTKKDNERFDWELVEIKNLD